MWLETTRQHWLGCLGLDAAAGCQLQMQDGWLLFVGLGLAWLLIRGGSRLFNAIYTLRAAAPDARAVAPPVVVGQTPRVRRGCLFPRRRRRGALGGAPPEGPRPLGHVLSDQIRQIRRLGQ